MELRQVMNSAPWMQFLSEERKTGSRCRPNRIELVDPTSVAQKVKLQACDTS